MLKPRILDDGLPEFGYLRASQIHLPHGALPISRSQFWSLVKERDVPSCRASPRVTLFLVKDIRRAFFGIDKQVEQ
jgi:hypothetical protein